MSCTTWNIFETAWSNESQNTHILYDANGFFQAPHKSFSVHRQGLSSEQEDLILLK